MLGTLAEEFGTDGTDRGGAAARRAGARRAAGREHSV